jgi:tripartite-type tricarboxylate transporter receptor subunit TctC
MALLLVAHVFGCPSVQAQGFPDRAVTIVLPIGPGGGTDILARLIAAKLAASWKQTVIVDHKIGGQGSIAGKFVSRSKPDGHTIFLAAAGNITISPLLSDLGYDPIRELTPITVLASAPYVLVVNPEKVKARDIKGFLELARSKSNQISWGSSTIGSPDHLAGELFQLQTNVKINHVPYKQAGLAITDLLGGHIHAAFLTIPSTLQHIQRGLMRPLGVSDSVRSSLLPEVPTIEEAGVRDYSMLTWYGVFVPAGTPATVVQKIADDSASIIRQDDVQRKLAELGFDPKGLSPKEVVNFIRAEVTKYGRVVDSTGLKGRITQ